MSIDRNIEMKALRPAEDKALRPAVDGEVLIPEPVVTPAEPVGVKVVLAHYTDDLPGHKPGDILDVTPERANTMIVGGIARLAT